VRSRCTVFFNDVALAEQAQLSLRELAAVISSRVEPSVGLEVEFDPALISETHLMDELRQRGFLPDQV
jgi:hypothetical protein